MSMPGERLGGPDSPVIKLILAMEQFGARFPGFEREVHGIEVDEHGKYWMRAVIEETVAEKENRATEETANTEPSTESPLLADRPIRRSTS